ncbi:MAG: methyltransferase domain-containing protein [Chloroflexota bacterium]|nr:methyltransferase domain-containing protein [Chloroflexota bacterium]
MTAVRAQWAAYIDQQHRYPTGLVGQIIGERMLRQHAPETEWSVGLLHIQPNDRILEIGFGAGRGLALALAQAHQGRVTGVDLSAAMIRAAARRNRTAIEHGRLLLVRGNVATLPLGEQRFDKLFSIHTFYFWPDPSAVCTRLISVLAHPGRLVSTFATARKQLNGSWAYWDVDRLAEALVKQLDHYPNITATLLYGPDSRAYNNVAIVIDKA